MLQPIFASLFQTVATMAGERPHASEADRQRYGQNGTEGEKAAYSAGERNGAADHHGRAFCQGAVATLLLGALYLLLKKEE